MTPDTDREAIVDAEHLKVLAIGYYVTGGVSAFFALFPLIYVVLGFVFLCVGGTAAARGHGHGQDAPPVFLGFLMMFGGLLFSLILAALGAVKIYAARCLQQRRHRVYCLVAGALSCLAMPYGVALGIFTFIILSRTSVARRFAQAG